MLKSVVAITHSNCRDKKHWLKPKFGKWKARLSPHDSAILPDFSSEAGFGLSNPPSG